MKENKYDEKDFFLRYGEMPRSVRGLEAAGEWHELRKMLPDFRGKRVVNLGCGYGWHCRYARERGAEIAVGIDISERMIAEARRRTDDAAVRYVRLAIEDADFPPDSFDVVLSSLAFHYVESFGGICAKAALWLTKGGEFVFSVEHPVFTAYGNQDWHYDGKGGILHWPVDRYFDEGIRTAVFLGEKVQKYHRKLDAYVNTLIGNGFSVESLVEPEPDPRLISENKVSEDERRRPMFLLVKARKMERRLV